MVKFINFITLVVATLLWAVTFKNLYNWIPAEIFNLKNISFMQALAIGLFIDFILFKKNDLKVEKDKTDEEELALSITYLVVTLIVLGFGYILSLFI
jgi:hypothetical protein